MPQVEVAASVIVRENQQDATSTGEVVVSIKDTSVDDYNGPISVTVAANSSRTIDVAHLPSLRMLILKIITGTKFRLSLRRAASENTDLEVGRFFAAELFNAEQVKLTNEGSAEIRVQVELVGIPTVS